MLNVALRRQVQPFVAMEDQTNFIAGHQILSENYSPSDGNKTHWNSTC